MKRQLMAQTAETFKRLYDRAFYDDRSLVILIILCKVFTDITYVMFVARYYDTAGMTCDIEPLRILIMNTLFLSLIPLILSHLRKAEYASDYITLTWDFMYFVPGMSYMTFKECSYKFAFYYLAFYLALCMANRLSIDLCQGNKNSIREYRVFFYTFFSGLIVLCAYYVIKYHGINVYVTLNNVYEIRADFAEKASRLSRVFLYIKSPLSKVIPILLYVFCRKRKVLHVIILSLIQLSLFTMGANKIDFLWLFIAIAASFVKDLSNKWIVLGFFCIAIVSAVSSVVLPPPKEGVFNSLLVRRMMLLPNHLGYLYFDFFQTNPCIWFSDTVLRKVLRYPFDEQISYIIGEILYHHRCNGNNGLVGVSFADCGYFGIIIYPMLYGIVFYFLNWFSRGKDRGVVILVSFMIAVIYIDSNFFTSILTHGIALMLLFIMLLPADILKCSAA